MLLLLLGFFLVETYLVGYRTKVHFQIWEKISEKSVRIWYLFEKKIPQVIIGISHIFPILFLFSKGTYNNLLQYVLFQRGEAEKIIKNCHLFHCIHLLI